MRRGIADDPADDTGRRDHRHVGFCTPSGEPRPIVIVSIPGFGLPAITSAATVGSAEADLQVQQLLQPGGPTRQRTLLLEPHLQLGHLFLQRLILRPDAAEPHVVAPEVAGSPYSVDAVVPCTRANNPNVTA